MTTDEFRALARSLPEAVESSHMGHPDFRVRGKVFATLMYPDSGHGMVKLTPEQQRRLIAAAPDVFAPVKGGWGRRGCTQVSLAAATEDPCVPRSARRGGILRRSGSPRSTRWMTWDERLIPQLHAEVQPLCPEIAAREDIARHGRAEEGRAGADEAG